MSKSRTTELARLGGMLKALSNPQRLRIFLRLATACSPAACDASADGLRRCVGELGEGLGVTPSTVSHHLRELRQAGLMYVERRGQRIECWVSDEALQLLASFFAEINEQRGHRSTTPRAASSRRSRWTRQGAKDRSPLPAATKAEGARASRAVPLLAATAGRGRSAVPGRSR